MNKKHKITNARRCIATGEIKDKKELIRIVKTKNNEFFIDSDTPGRGAYISRDASLIKVLWKKKLLNRTFKYDVPKQIYEQLVKIMEETNEG